MKDLEQILIEVKEKVGESMVVGGRTVTACSENVEFG